MDEGEDEEEADAVHKPERMYNIFDHIVYYCIYQLLNVLMSFCFNSVIWGESYKRFLRNCFFAWVIEVAKQL